MILIALLVCLINAPIKGTQWSFLGAAVIIILFVTGMSGLAYRETKDDKVEIGVKGLVVESGIHFSNVVLTFFETAFIMCFNIIISSFFVIVPLLISGYSNDDKNISFRIMTVIAVIVFIYRLPLFMMSYFTHIVNKESGRFGVIRIKEIMAKRPVIWIHLIFQVLIYGSLTFAKFSINQNWQVYTLIDVFAGILFLIFIIADLYLYLETIEKHQELNERFDRNYKGIYKGILGRFFI